MSGRPGHVAGDAALRDAMRDILEKARSAVATRADGMLLSHDESAMLRIHLEGYLDLEAAPSDLPPEKRR